MKNMLIDIDSELVDLELTWDKAAVMCSDVREGYFSEKEPKDWFLKTYYDESGIKLQILLDYLYTMRKSMEELRTLLNKEFEKESRKAA